MLWKFYERMPVIIWYYIHISDKPLNVDLELVVQITFCHKDQLVKKKNVKIEHKIQNRDTFKNWRLNLTVTESAIMRSNENLAWVGVDKSNEICLCLIGT
jgi:hypothetical protein